MTRFFSLVAAVGISLLLAFTLGEGPNGAIAFGIAGLMGGWLAQITPPGSELVYWSFVLVTLVLFLTGVFLLNLHELIVIFPLVLTAAYFVARLILRITGRTTARTT